MASFVRPTVDELQVYAKEIGWTNFDAEYFLAKNDAVGWVDNRQIPYVQWKGVVMIWFKAAQKRGDIKEAGKSFKDMYNENKI